MRKTFLIVDRDFNGKISLEKTAGYSANWSTSKTIIWVLCKNALVILKGVDQKSQLKKTSENFIGRSPYWNF